VTTPILPGCSIFTLLRVCIEKYSAQLVCNRQLRLDSYYAFYNFRLKDVVERKYVSKESVRFRL
jgi:hypothetical protein